MRESPLVEADVIRSTSRSSDTAHIGGGGDVTSRLPQLRRVLTGRKSAGFACDQVVAREFHDARGRLSVAQHERPAALNRRSMVSSGKHRRSRVQRLSSAMICATDRRVRAREPRGRRSGWASAQRRKSRSRCRTVRPCGKPQLEVGLGHLGQGHVSVLRSQVRKSAATLSRSCAYLRTLLVTGPWRSAGDPARRNSAAASRGLRIYVEFDISRLMPTTGLCRPWRGAHPFGLPAARARLCRAVGATARRADRPIHRPPRAQGLTSHSVKVLVGGG